MVVYDRRSSAIGRTGGGGGGGSIWTRGNVFFDDAVPFSGCIALTLAFKGRCLGLCWRNYLLIPSPPPAPTDSISR